MMMNKTMALSALPLTLKRRREDLLKSAGATKVKKSKLATKDETPLQGIGNENALVAQALLQLKSNTRSPMCQWVKLFDEESTDEDTSSSEDENMIVQALVKAAFSKKQRLMSPAVQRIVSAPEQIKPDDFLHKLLASKGKTVKYTPASRITGFFTKVSDEYVEGYSMEVVKAVRADDVATLRRLKAEGRTMLCGTKFGDSIVHLACRRSCVKVLDFLLNEVGISPRLVCDFGRTPLHDALWTSQPNERIVNMLVTACPDLLYVTDSRGSTPLAYLPKVHWPAMCRFLEHCDASNLVAKEIHQ